MRERLGLGEGTAVGEAIFSSLDLLKQDPGEETGPTAIVVLSDGETTVGRPDSEAATAAAEAGVPVYTVAFGTPQGTLTIGGEVIPVPPAEGKMRAVAEATGGQFFATANENDLAHILTSIASEIGYETEEREVTDWFAAIGLVLIAAAVARSIRWFGRMV